MVEENLQANTGNEFLSFLGQQKLGQSYLVNLLPGIGPGALTYK